MLTLPATTQPTLPLLAAAARLLSGDQGFADRVDALFGLLREAVQFHDARLVFWHEPGGARAQLTTPNGWHEYWIDDLTELAEQRGASVHTTIPLGKLLDGAAGDLPDELTYLGTPIAWNGQTWGVLELRAPGPALRPTRASLVGALVPLLAAAIALESGALALPALARTSTDLRLLSG